MRIKRYAFFLVELVLAVLVLWLCFGQSYQAYPDNQVITTQQKSGEDLRAEATLAIARMYDLSRDQAILMLAIYDHELAPREQMITYGYFGMRRSDHPIIQRCKRDETLFLVCASLCAQTIKNRCPVVTPKSVHALGNIYATNPQWSKCVWAEMKKYKDTILY
jgi:hypothetical protein